MGRIAALPADMKNMGTAYGPVQRALTAMEAALDRPFDLAGFAREAGCGCRHSKAAREFGLASRLQG